MKIRDVYTSAVAGSQRVRKRRGSEEVEGVTGVSPRSTDQVFFTQRSLEVQRARGLAMQAPEIRELLVNEISESIREGQYQVSGADVAPKLIQDHVSLVRG